jgi:hypothetical protein
MVFKGQTIDQLDPQTAREHGHLGGVPGVFAGPRPDGGRKPVPWPRAPDGAVPAPRPDARGCGPPVAGPGLCGAAWTPGCPASAGRRKQMVEIAKALRTGPEVLILDEPTASLTDGEAEKLFEAMARLKARGVGIIYVSHRMREIRDPVGPRHRAARRQAGGHRPHRGCDQRPADRDDGGRSGGQAVPDHRRDAGAGAAARRPPDHRVSGSVLRCRAVAARGRGGRAGRAGRLRAQRACAGRSSGWNRWRKRRGDPVGAPRHPSPARPDAAAGPVLLSRRPRGRGPGHHAPRARERDDGDAGRSGHRASARSCATATRRRSSALRWKTWACVRWPRNAGSPPFRAATSRR